jgi:hypothetical protein
VEIKPGNVLTKIEVNTGETYIAKRGTRNARDMLLENLIKYQKDQGPPRMDSFRHLKPYIKTRECVQFGDIILNRQARI